MPCQIILGSFIADAKKSSSSILQPGASSAPIPNMLSFGAPVTSSPPSQGPSSESSDDNGSSPSPLNRTGIYNPGQQPLHNMQMYQQIWASQTQQWRCFLIEGIALWIVDMVIVLLGDRGTFQVLTQDYWIQMVEDRFIFLLDQVFHSVFEQIFIPHPIVDNWGNATCFVEEYHLDEIAFFQYIAFSLLCIPLLVFRYIMYSASRHS